MNGYAIAGADFIQSCNAEYEEEANTQMLNSKLHSEKANFPCRPSDPDPFGLLLHAGSDSVLGFSSP